MTKGFFSLLTMRPAAVKGLWSPKGLDEYRVHQSLWKVFSEQAGRPRDFIYREKDETEGATTPTFYVVSRRAPMEDDPFWAVQTKAYAPVLEVGDRLAFNVRLNATRSQREAETNKEIRHDAIMHYLKQNEGAPRSEALQEVASTWLGERAERCGFKIEGLVVNSWEPRKLTPKGRAPITFNALDLQGLLEVTDVAAFTKVIFEGLGRSRGFGCGLVMVRRA